MTDSSPIVLCLALVIALFLWLEGYRLYRLAVFFLGFITGFSLSGAVAKFIPSIPVSVVIVQVAIGIIVGAAAFLVLKLGLFIAAACAAFFVLNGLLQSLSTMGVILSFAAAVIAGFIATKADKPVIIVITGIAGGFAIPSILYKLSDAVSYDLSFLPEEKSFIWLIVKIVLAAIGIAIQFTRTGEDD